MPSLDDKRDCLGGIDVVVLAGGLGTRLADALPDTPKILAPVGGRVFLDILIERLAGFGTRRIVMSLGHRAHQVRDHLAAMRLDRIEIVPVVEPAPLGTAGALRFVASYVESDPFLVINGDSFVDVDLCAFAEAHTASGRAASIVVTEVDDAGRFGTVELSPNATILRFKEKGGAGRGIINAGVYLFSSAMTKQIDAMPGASLERDVFEQLAPGTIHAFAGRFPFIDIGTPADLARAEEVLRPYIAETEGVR
jgi:NDP-sugar pyrophosphorylase family protein